MVGDHEVHFLGDGERLPLDGRCQVLRLCFAAEVELVELAERERRLSRALAAVSDRYDLVLIDCPPALGLLTLNALVAAETMTGRDGNTAHALPHDRLVEVMRKYGRV